MIEEYNMQLEAVKLDPSKHPAGAIEGYEAIIEWLTEELLKRTAAGAPSPGSSSSSSAPGTPLVGTSASARNDADDAFLAGASTPATMMSFLNSLASPDSTPEQRSSLDALRAELTTPLTSRSARVAFATPMAPNEEESDEIVFRLANGNVVVWQDQDSPTPLANRLAEQASPDVKRLTEKVRSVFSSFEAAAGGDQAKIHAAAQNATRDVFNYFTQHRDALNEEDKGTLVSLMALYGNVPARKNPPRSARGARTLFNVSSFKNNE